MNYELLREKYDRSNRNIYVIYAVLFVSFIAEVVAGWFLLPRHWLAFTFSGLLFLFVLVLFIFFGGAIVFDRLEMRKKFFREVSKSLHGEINPRSFFWIVRFQMSRDLRLLAKNIVLEEREYREWRNRSPEKSPEELALHKELDYRLSLIRAEFPKHSRESRMLRRMIGNHSLPIPEKVSMGKQLLVSLEEREQKLQQEPAPGSEGTRFQDMLDRFYRLAGENPPKAALRLVELAKAKTKWKDQRELLVRAIGMLGSIATAEEHLKLEVEQEQENSFAPDVIETKLHKLAHETFNIEPYFPEDLDGQTAKQILLALMDLGRGVHIFGNNYRPSDKVLDLVEKRFRILRKIGCIEELYHPTSCVQTLIRLHREGVLVSKQKTNVMTYSLCNKPGNARSDWADAVIRESNRFYNTFPNK